MLKIDAYTACCGYGDLFMILPWIEKRKMPSLVLSSHYDEGTGIPQLLQALFPKMQCKFRDRKYFFENSAKYYHNPLREVAVGRGDLVVNCPWIQKFDINRFCLSDRVIDRIPPLPNTEPFLVVHPVSQDATKNYSGWDHIKFDVPIKVVGTWGYQNPVRGQEFHGSFYEVARLLRTSIGLLGLDSSVMNLAKVLRVPSVVIYPNKERLLRTPCYGLHLVNPSPQEVTEAVRRLVVEPSGIITNLCKKGISQDISFF